MNKKDESRQDICWILLNCARYSLTLLLGAVLLSDSVGAISHSDRLLVTNRLKGVNTGIKNNCTHSNKLVETGFVCGSDDLSFWSDKKNTGLIAQQPESSSQQSTRAAAQKAFDEGDAFFKEGSAESLRQAIKKFEIALQLWQKVGDKANQALTSLGIGKVYSDLGEKQKALEYYNQALPLYHAVGDKGGVALTLNNIGLVYSALGEKQKALQYYNQALGLRRAVGDRGGEATTLNNIGAVYSNLGEKQKALQYYNQALGLYRAVGNRGGEATTLSNIGGVYSNLGEKQKALQYYNQALPLDRAVGDRGGEANTLFNLAYLERDQGNLEQSLKQIEVAIKIIEDLRTKIDNQDLRTSYFASVQGYYKFYIDLLMQLHKKNPSKGYDALALHISERSRARGLIELLTEARADIRKGVDPKLLAEEQRLQQFITAISR